MTRRSVLVSACAPATMLFIVQRDTVAQSVPRRTSDAASSELKRAAERAELCSPTNASGTGLRGEYFADDLPDGVPLLTRTDGPVDFDAALDWPVREAMQRPKFARWTGWVKPPVSGRYRFHVDQPGVLVLVSRQPMVGPNSAASASIDLAAGRFYPITIEARHMDGFAGRLQLQWTVPHGARFVVPRALLFLPNESAPTTKS